MRTKNEFPDDDLYARLEVNPRACPEVIHAAFRALAPSRHPDPGGDAAGFTRLKEAFEILGDPAKRADYDDVRNVLDGKVIGAYRVLKFIAEGGFGKTYRGEHVRLHAPVCIKHCSAISPESDALLEREANAMWGLRHYAIPAVHDLLKLDDGSSALVMSYIEGPTLAQIVEKNGKIDAEHVAWIMWRVLNALQYLHFNGVVHGDIKPQNIIVQPKRHMAVLVDFGLSMVKPKGDDKNLGYTQLFSPPEQERGEPLIPETDFYSLGMTAIYALTASEDRLRRRELPNTVPGPMRDFLGCLVAHNTLSRPNWNMMDLCDEIAKVRERSFGRVHSNMKQLDV